MKKTTTFRYFEGRNEKFVANIEVGDGLLKKKDYPFQSSPKWYDWNGVVFFMSNPFLSPQMKSHSPQPSIYFEFRR